MPNQGTLSNFGNKFYCYLKTCSLEENSLEALKGLEFKHFFNLMTFKVKRISCNFKCLYIFLNIL